MRRADDDHDDNDDDDDEALHSQCDSAGENENNTAYHGRTLEPQGPQRHVELGLRRRVVVVLQLLQPLHDQRLGELFI